MGPFERVFLPLLVGSFFLPFLCRPDPFSSPFPRGSVFTSPPLFEDRLFFHVEASSSFLFFLKDFFFFFPPHWLGWPIPHIRTFCRFGFCEPEIPPFSPFPFFSVLSVQCFSPPSGAVFFQREVFSPPLSPDWRQRAPPSPRLSTPPPFLFLFFFFAHFIWYVRI